MPEVDREPGVPVDVGPALAKAGKRAARHTIGWLVAGAVVVVAVLALDPSETGVGWAIAAATVALVIVGWSVRTAVALRLALRDFQRDTTAPRRVYVVVLNDVHPRSTWMWRPLLAIWSAPPPAGARLPRPDEVYRCDQLGRDLLSWAGAVHLHEAWVDTGSGPGSRPSWVAADAGIAVAHRRALFGRWYANLLLRGARAPAASPLTIPAPRP